ncbi:MAG TPA: hypothetical protein VER14_01275 [Phototrophicaceae bacterium]|nr:hypothetical protein [Phototrophicaceae bacterium]
MFNNNHAKTSLSNVKYIFMVTAIASVLALGTGYSAMQSFGTLEGSGLLAEITKSAECLADLTEGQQEALFQELNVDSIEEANIAIEELSANALLQILVDKVGLTTDAAQSVLGCLGFEIDLDIIEPIPTDSTSTSTD